MGMVMGRQDDGEVRARSSSARAADQHVVYA